MKNKKNNFKFRSRYADPIWPKIQLIEWDEEAIEWFKKGFIPIKFNEENNEEKEA